jgi:hypothetical protein
MHHRFATSLEKTGPALIACSIGSRCSGAKLVAQARRFWLAAWLLALLAFSTAAAAPVAGPSPAPNLQPDAGVTMQMYLLPAEDSSIQLQTHVANATVTDNGDGSVSALMNAEYRVHNPADEAITLPLLIYPGRGTAQPQDLSLAAGGEILGLTPAAGGGFSAQVELAADSRMTLRLRYRITVSDSPLVTIRYAPSVLRRWRGAVSTRIEYTVPDTVARESWTRIAPDTWSYAISAPGVTTIKWLYDSIAPNEEFIIQFVAPSVWSQVQQAEAGSGANGQASAFLTKGNLYSRLAQAEAADETLRDRFSAQAIAAYTEGLARSASASSEELAQMHIGLASLYRNKAAQGLHDPVPLAALIVEEASAAQSLLSPQESRRIEVQQWLADGLRILFDDAKKRDDWQQASRLVDQMTALPPGTVDAAIIEEARQMVLVQQALQLLRRGERDAAAALAGAEITDETAMPPVALQPLFASWHITVTAQPEIVTFDLRAVPSPGREEEARSRMDGLAAAWQSAGAAAASTGEIVTVTSANDLRVEFAMPISVDGERLASYVPAGADWALLRSALAQINPQTEERTRFFQRELLRRQPMDLRSAGEQWSAMAANLNREAAIVGSEATADDPKSVLLAEIRVAGYQETAAAWRSLARDSWLLFQFQPGDDSDAQTRAWYTTATSPPVVLSMQTQSVDINLVTGLAIAAMAIIVGFSGLLWWLM